MLRRARRAPPSPPPTDRRGTAPLRRRIGRRYRAVAGFPRVRPREEADLHPIRRLPPRATRRLRQALARHPWTYWFAVGALGAAAYVLAAARTDAADRARAAWGSTSPVLVAVGPIAPGDPLAGRVTPHRYPSALAPPGALAELPPDAVARQALDTGDPLRAADVAGTGPLALVPDGWVVAPVVESPRSGAEVGDRVQVVSDGVVLADSARVVGFVDGTGETVTLVAAPEGVAAVLPAARPGDLALLRLP